MLVLGSSYGAGIITKLIATAPERIEKSVLLVPAGIKNNLSLNIMPLALSMLQYRLTKNKSYLLKNALQLAASADSRDLEQHILPTSADSFDHVHVRAGMPSNILEQSAKKCKAPLLIIAAEKDCLFPAKKVLPRAQAIFSNCQTYLLENRGHLCYLTKQEEQQIITFFKGRTHHERTNLPLLWGNSICDS
ncbi:alpha/beta fold hydrolase [Streptococcus tangpeifui]|uniref:alpha/beta fold hydrolase n=1 Tax=Streptococcus tangpeifui TaxID=2709400 RepID=UPI00197E9E23|nr:alpha/beta hydrolase [Streptococcus sp. ZJ373]